MMGLDGIQLQVKMVECDVTIGSFRYLKLTAEPVFVVTNTNDDR